MPGPDPKNTKNIPPKEIRGQVNKKSRGSLGKSKPPKELVPTPPPKKMKKGGRA